MSETKSKLRPKVEIILMLVFFLAFMSWAITKCNAVKRQYREAALREAMEEEFPAIDSSRLAEVVSDSSRQDSTVAEDRLKGTVRERYTPLFVTIDGLNLRTEPSLKSEVILKLSLFEEVEFLNEVTEFRDSVSLGTEIAYEPWIKVRHRKGRSGWVYGAGVHYYKIKREGAY